jgi:hypothetical protein
VIDRPDVHDRLAFEAAALAERERLEAVSVLVSLGALEQARRTAAEAARWAPAVAADSWPARRFGRVLHVEAVGNDVFECAVEVVGR